jgi:hypothetical protein
MNIKLNQFVATIIGILLATILLASACSPVATPSPTLLPPTSIPTTPTPDLIGLVKAYEEAFNRHDPEAIMVMFADKSKYQWGGWTTAIVNQDISDLHDYFVSVNEEIQNTGCTIEGSVVKCQAVFRDDCTKSAGMDGEHFTSVVYNIENGKIQKVTAIELSKDNIKLNYFYNRMLNWSQKNNSEEYNKLFNEYNSFTWNQESGTIMSKFCQEYVDTIP